MTPVVVGHERRVCREALQARCKALWQSHIRVERSGQAHIVIPAPAPDAGANTKKNVAAPLDLRTRVKRRLCREEVAAVGYLALGSSKRRANCSLSHGVQVQHLGGCRLAGDVSAGSGEYLSSPAEAGVMARSLGLCRPMGFLR